MKIFIFNKFFMLLLLLLFIFSIVLGLCIFYKDSVFVFSNVNNFDSLVYNNNGKIAYLTFDDGPTTKATAKILDILLKNNVKATFFVVGKHVKENPELVNRAYSEGHYIANHSYNHNNSLLYKNTSNFINEIKSTDFEIGKAIGIPDYCSKIFRFPNGYMSSSYSNKKHIMSGVLKENGYVYVDWNCLNKDSEIKYSRDQLLQNLKDSSKNKGNLVILMHDTCDVNDTPSVLEDSISYLNSLGYEFHNFYDFFN